MAKIELKNISKIYPNGVEAVKNVSFSAENGEFIVLVGPSGCGKTTILRMIAGLEEITKGDLLFDGKIMNDEEPKSRNIGMVFQEYALYPHLTVFENIAFPLKVLKKTDSSKKILSKENIKNQVLEIAEQLELTQLLKRKPKELSGGQRQRVALGRAIIRQPKLFLFDEPLSNLDAKLRVLMRQEIISLQRKFGITSIYVTHDQTEAMTMGTKIAVIKDGVLQQFDTPFVIYNNPANIFVADFIGSPHINFFDGTFSDSCFIEENSDFKIEKSLLNCNEKICRDCHAEAARNDGNIANRHCEPQALQSFFKNNSKIILGLRPENIKLGQNFATGFINFSTVIANIEFLGNELIIYFRTGKNSLKRIQTSPNQNLKIGDKIDCNFDVRSLLFFDENGVRM